MPHTLEQLSDGCRRILSESPGPEGRLKVCALLQEFLLDEAFVAAHLDDNTPERKLLYQDPQLGFCILAHHFRGTRDSVPHDHGPTWAIYGQARGETMMSDWEVVEPATPSHPGSARRVRSYPLKPGMAHLYNEGQLHSPRREASTWLIRIEGKNLEGTSRPHYHPV